MDAATSQPRLCRFGPFELDARTGELRRGGTRIRIGGHAFQILLMLIERRGEAVLRDEIQLRLWPGDTIVEFDQGINTAVRQLRNALRDSADKPRYVETVARRGYRFLVPVEEATAAAAATTRDTGDRSGTTLLHFKVGPKLGSGGMGVVYRAEDLQLGRQVALKFLRRPVEELSAPARQRFEREARAQALLNHPHICSIFGVASIDGQPIIVMELLSGETLAARLLREPLGLPEALLVGVQVVDALAEAHRNGLTHGDLKPSNIMLTSSGAKLLDFGLVNAAGVERDSTAGRTILGTPAYMSPEQAEGKETDWRTDIFVFGLVLREMLAGNLSESLQPIVDRCLARNPRERWQSAGDLKASLQQLAGEKQNEPRPRSYRPALWVAAAVVASLMVGGAAALWLRGKPPEVPLVKLNVAPPGKGIQIYTGGGSSVALSPDGRRVVFSAINASGVNQLWVRAFDTLEARPLPGTEDARYPFWSPDSLLIGFNAEGKLKTIGLNGGPPVTLTDAIFLRGASWSRGGVIAFAPNSVGPLLSIATTGGAATPLTTLAKGERSHRAPWFLPDGRHFLYAAKEAGSHVPIRVGLLDSSTPQDPKTVVEADSNVIYAGDERRGHLLFLRGNTLMAQPFDPVRLETAGAAVPVAEHVENRVTAAIGLFSASENGMLIYASGDQRLRQLSWFDRSGKRLSAVGDPGLLADMALSPDRNQVAVAVSEHGKWDVWIYNLPSGKRARLTFGPGLSWAPVWSPDGRTIAYRHTGKGRTDLYRKASSGTGAEEQLYSDDADKSPSTWSPDGRFLLYTARDPKTAADLWMLPMTGKPSPWLQTSFLEEGAQFSPDGKWVAYSSNESGRGEIYIASFPGPGGKRQVTTTGGGHVQWKPDGRELFYIAPDLKLTAVRVNVSASAVEVGEPQSLFGPMITGGGSPYSVSADGQRILAEMVTDSSRELTVVQNWTAALKK